MELFKTAKLIKLTTQYQSEDAEHTALLERMSDGETITAHDIRNYKKFQLSDEEFKFVIILTPEIEKVRSSIISKLIVWQGSIATMLSVGGANRRFLAKTKRLSGSRIFGTVWPSDFGSITSSAIFAAIADKPDRHLQLHHESVSLSW